MFSLLSRGYGTYDGKAKKDTQETREHKEYFSLEDLHLPPIRSNYQALAQKDTGEYDSGPRYENKPFKLPKVEDTKHSIRNVPKTYTTRKGALLLYAEDFFLPGSPKPRKRRRKYKKQQTMKLKTIGDLRNYILDYRNGGDPLFLALLEKRMSGHKDQSVRPGFSPKRYIATLGNSLEEDTWNRLAATGSFKDPSLLTYIPQRTPEHGEAVCSLFSGKPQPYSTMSLPPISPSSSMLESSFHFYKNGMSTGAASMISLNSETEEYAPSSRALSPAESLNDRLSEVEFLPQRKDPYSQLNSTQKENLLSQLLLQRTLESMNSDLSDLQGWVTNYPESGGGMEKDPVSVVTISKSKAKHRGSLKSGSLSSIPRLPPIQSAGARPSTPVELKEESPLPQISMEQTIHQQPDITTEKDETDNILDPSSVHLHLSSILVDENIPFVDQGDLQGRSQGDGDTVSYSKETTADIEDDMKQEDQSENASQSVIMGKSSEESDRPGIQRRPNKWKENSGCENSVEDQVMIKSDDMIALDDIVLSEDTTYDDKRQSTQGEEIKHKQTLENVDQMEERSEDDSQPQVQKIDMAELDHTHTKADDEDEGIGIDEGVVDMSEKMGVADDNLAITEEGIQTSQENTSLPPAEPPPPISLEELQGEARTVASKVLSRPQSGMVFMEDIKAAIAMWADRLTNLLGPPRQAERVSSANHQRQHSTHLAAKEGLLRHARHRKMSRSAGPSPAALREALRISGGEVMEIEVLKNLPPLPKRLSKTSQSQPPGLDTSVHKFYEKHGSASTKRSGSSNAAQSIPWERVSNADVQVDVFSYATKDEEPSFHRVQFDEIDDEESDDEDEEFKTALDAVVTEVKQDYTLIEARSRVETSSPKKEQKPFQFPRPAESKPPAGLQNKQTQGQVKGKAKSVPAKKKPVVKKRAGKKSTKEPSKASNKTSKTGKGKGETQKKNHQEKQENLSDVKAAEGEKTDPLRVDSETGEHEPATSQRTVVSSALSGVTSSRVSSKASDGLSEKKTADSPSERHDTPVVEVPFLAPKPTEPQIIQPEPEPEVERTPEPEEQKPSQESRAARRAAERAAAAERRRQEVERKRREREEAKKRAAEEETRLQKLRLEAEEEMKKREEELRRKREEKEEEKRRKQEEEMEQERLASIKIERERRAKEDWKNRQQQVLAQRKLEEELRKEQEKIEAELEAARLREEEERIKAMEESDRIAFLEKMRQEEEELRRRLEEQRRKEERERKLREEERKQREDALALLRQKQLQRHLFIAGILKESHYLSLSQRLTKAFTFSYFDLIPWNHLQHLKPPPSPVRDLLHSVRENIPPTILEEDEVTED